METTTIIRLAVLLLAIVNSFLASKGISPIPLEEELISNIILAVVAIYTTYKDTPISKEAKDAHKEMKVAKAEKQIAKNSGGAPVVDVDESENNGNI